MLSYYVIYYEKLNVMMRTEKVALNATDSLIVNNYMEIHVLLIGEINAYRAL